MSRAKQQKQVEEKVQEQYKKEREESNAIELDGVVYKEDLKLNGGQLEDSYFKWLEDNNLLFAGGLNHVNCTDDKPSKKQKQKNFIPWYSYIFLAITYFIGGMCIDRWIVSDIDPLILITGIWLMVQMSIVIYLSLKDLNKDYNKLFRNNK